MYSHGRFEHLFALGSALVLLRNLPQHPGVTEKTSGIRAVLFVCALAVVILLGKNDLRLNTGPKYVEEPRESLDFIKSNKIPGPIFNEYGDGGQLIWELYPEYKVFIDGRTPNLYDANFFWIYRAAADKGIFEDLVKKYSITTVIYPHHFPFVKEALPSDTWHLVFFDNYDSVYVRETDATKQLIADRKYLLLNPSNDKKFYESLCLPEKENERAILTTEASRNIGELQFPVYGTVSLSTLAITCEYSESYRGLEQQLTDLISNAPRSRYTPLLYQHRGTLRLRLGRAAEAAEDFKQALKISPNSVEHLTGLGTAYFNLSEYSTAAKIFERIVRMAGYEKNVPATLYQIFGWTLYHLDQNQRAIDYMQRYLKAVGEEKITAVDYLYLSRVYRDAGKQSEADLYLQKAIALDPSIE